MSEAEWGFSPPPFQPQDALERLRRALRDLGLQERQGLWERRGVTLARLVPQPTAIEASRVKKPTRSSPEWVARTLRSAADVRDFTADLKKQLALWSDDHD